MLGEPVYAALDSFSDEQLSHTGGTPEGRVSKIANPVCKAGNKYLKLTEYVYLKLGTT